MHPHGGHFAPPPPPLAPPAPLPPAPPSAPRGQGRVELHGDPQSGNRLDFDLDIDVED